MGGCQPHQRLGVNFMGGEAALPTNPNKGHADTSNIKM